MPVLNWIGKEAVVNHDKDVPFKLLKKVKSSSVEENSENLIIKGDNLEALKALMPYYKGKIKCVYIDPPYNTGNEKWRYNDNVNSPKIKKWLGQVVGRESEDLCRHDKWLCMMYPRLKLLKDLLSEDGVIFVSIDDNEQAHLKNIMDEIFGEINYKYFVWKKKGGAGNTEKVIGTLTEHILCYFKNKSEKPFNYRNIERTYKFRDNKGPYNLEGIEKTNMGAYERKTMLFSIINPKTKEEFYPKKNMRWTAGEKTIKNLILENRLFFDEKKKRVFIIKRPEDYEKSENVYYNLLLEFGSLSQAKSELEKLGFDRELFDTPKPIDLIKHLLKISTSKNDLILDSFAGSGTTGHAVLDLNKDDEGNRKFILIEMEDDIAKKVTAERIKKAIKKYDYNAGFEFCELDKPLFNEFGDIDESCSFEQLANYIYFTETQTNIDKKKIENNLIGEYQNFKYYLLFKEKGKNILDKSFFDKIKNIKDNKVVYADKCLIDDNLLDKYNIIFKQIPYEVKIY
ncbi:MAG: site-specific DNA-methyltransferase [Candidatus Nanoarchaeia archaeon]|jgi:adenine specific DNA methylase Mod